ncbi:MAG: hypothetical protein ABI763_05080 [Bacteroidota bacterium]
MKNLLAVLLIVSLASCRKKEDDSTPDQNTTSTSQLIFRFHFDSTQARLNNFGAVTGVPAGHGSLSPHFNLMSAHYIELAQDSFTLLGNGAVVYRAPEVNNGGLAIDFDQAVLAADGGIFFSIPLSQVAAGTYKWLRVSLAYQNYDISYRYYYNTVPYDAQGTIASFIGFNTYIHNYTIKDSTIAVNANKLQGFWGFETTNFSITTVSQGQAPPGATTVPNPLAFTSPVPAGSCVVTGKFDSPLIISSSGSTDKTVTVSVSTNHSFEWVEHSNPLYFEPLDGDTVIDMGVRGIEPHVQ